jgi:hypothetical protein
MYRYGFLDESQNKLDYVLALTPQDVLERRLQVGACAPLAPPTAASPARWPLPRLPCGRLMQPPLSAVSRVSGLWLGAPASGCALCQPLDVPPLGPAPPQTLVFKLGLAKSIHHARVLIRQRHIRVGKQIVNIPSFMVRVDSQKHIDFALNSPFGGGRPGRVKRRSLASKGGADGGDDEE